MGTMASQITSLTIVYSAIYSGADQRKHQSSESLAFAQMASKTDMFPIDDVIMFHYFFLSRSSSQVPTLQISNFISVELSWHVLNCGLISKLLFMYKLFVFDGNRIMISWSFLNGSQQKSHNIFLLCFLGSSPVYSSVLIWAKCPSRISFDRLWPEHGRPKIGVH